MGVRLERDCLIMTTLLLTGCMIWYILFALHYSSWLRNCELTSRRSRTRIASATSSPVKVFATEHSPSSMLHLAGLLSSLSVV